MGGTVFCYLPLTRNTQWIDSRLINSYGTVFHVLPTESTVIAETSTLSSVEAGIPSVYISNISSFTPLSDSHQSTFDALYKCFDNPVPSKNTWFYDPVHPSLHLKLEFMSLF